MFNHLQQMSNVFMFFVLKLAILCHVIFNYIRHVSQRFKIVECAPLNPVDEPPHRNPPAPGFGGVEDLGTSGSARRQNPFLRRPAELI